MSKSKSSMQMMAESAVAPKNEVAEKPVASKKAALAVVDTSVAVAEKAPAKAKKPEGPVQIETNQQLLKALWTSRGNVWLTSPDFPVPIGVVKSTMTSYLKDIAVAGAPAPYDLVPRKNADGSIDGHNSDLVPMAKK